MSLTVFWTTFGLIFLAELGDKTQLAVVSQVCRFRSPWAVFLGGSLALTVVTALGVAGGGLMGRWISPESLRLLAGAAFLILGGWIGWRSYRYAREGECELEGECGPTSGWWSWPAFGSTSGLLLISELGDKTQLAVIALAGRESAGWSVFLGASLALILVTALGALGGQVLCRWIPARLLMRLSALAFLVVGTLILIGVA